jgi:chemotaxis signal transduction protein
MNVDTDQMLTVEDVRGWLQVTEAPRKQLEAQRREMIVNRVLTEFTQQVGFHGLTVQDAADYTWRKWSRIASQRDERQLIRDTLKGIGWTRPSRGGKQ